MRGFWVAKLATGLVAVVAAGLSTGCGGTDASAAEKDLEVRGLIGPAGGELLLARGGKVAIPPGALATEIEIKITKLELEDIAPLPFNLEVAGKPYAFEPHGQNFALPVKITVPFNDDIADSAELRPVKLDDEEDTDWQTVVGSEKDDDDKTVAFETTSFSVVLAANPRRITGVVTLPDGAITSDAGSMDAATDASTDAMDAGVGRDAAIDAANAPDTGVDASVSDVWPSQQEAYIKASNSEADDNFGYSVALSADGSTMAVGAIGEASNATGANGDQLNNSFPGAGAVYIFTRVSGVWTQQAYVKASNPYGEGFDDDEFGHVVALSADGNTMAVGSRGEASNATGINGNQNDNSALNAGAVYVFTRTGTTWTQQAYVKASNTEADDYFGYSVALTADGNTMAVGARGEASNATGIGGNQADNSMPYAGAVYMFERVGSVWSQNAYIKASNPDTNDVFHSVSLTPDGNTLVVGAFNESSSATGVNGDETDNSVPNAGAAYVFERSGGPWAQTAYLKPDVNGDADYFGYAVAIAADANTLVVGAVREDGSATGINGARDRLALNSGAAYIFTRSGGIWSQDAYVKASNTHANDYFGASVAISSDGDTLAIGAYQDGSFATGINGDQTYIAIGAGAVYTFKRDLNVWTQRAFVKASNTADRRLFGYSVSMTADASLLAVGSYWDDSNATGINGDDINQAALLSGAVFVFR